MLRKLKCHLVRDDAGQRSAFRRRQQIEPGLAPPARLDLRVGARFTGDVARVVCMALQEAADLIARMPATFMTYPNGGPVLPTMRRRAPKTTGDILLDAEFLGSFGTLMVPRELWRALGRFAAWVEPALIAEWLRLMREYAARQNRVLDEGVLGTAMTWSEPTRDTAVVRERARALLDAGGTLHCAWSGRRLERATIDIDHCLPWTAWQCGDLWNLLPAHRRVNQHEKRDRLPTDDLLRRATEPSRGGSAPISTAATFCQSGSQTRPGQACPV